MTPKEKAQEIRDKFYVAIDGIYFSWEQCGQAKLCALIAVDLRIDGHFSFSSIEYGEDGIEFWEEVKKELSNL